MDADQKITHELTVIHAIELALVQTLTAHIAITPRGPYRAILERHLDETRSQARRIEERLRQLGATRNPVQVAVGTLYTAAGQVLALGKAPVDLLRGTSAEEKLVKNCRDEIASEALEIASYDALEALAEAVGDEKTAVLAREHRLQEEVALGELRGAIVDLAQAAAAAEVHGESSYDVGTTGAFDALRRGARIVRTGRFRGDGGGASDEGDVGAPAEAEVPLAAADVPPIEGYDVLTVTAVLPRLAGLSELELAQLDAYERAHRNRKQVLERIRRLREREPTGSA
jgi:ferritin-like metal-binding protein YciE